MGATRRDDVPPDREPAPDKVGVGDFTDGPEPEPEGTDEDQDGERGPDYRAWAEDVEDGSGDQPDILTRGTELGRIRRAPDGGESH
jgi:hypothetical protein